MNLTPLDIQQQQFPRGMTGYVMKEVRTFLEFVSREYQTALTALSARESDVRRLEEELFRYKEREDMLKEALVTAQRLAEDMRVQAKKEADLVIAEAEVKGERIIHHAHSRMLSILEEITDLKRERVKLAEGLRHVLSTHSKLLDVVDGGGRENEDPVSYLGAKKIVLEAPSLTSHLAASAGGSVTTKISPKKE